MPIYDYVCTNCGHEVEVIHSVVGHGPAACPKCGGHMRKAIVSAAVHFKGSGWARKDRAAARPSKPASPETSSTPGDALVAATESGRTAGGTSTGTPGGSSGETSGASSPKDSD